MYREHVNMTRAGLPQTWDDEPMLFHFRASLPDGGPTLKRYWFKALCLLPIIITQLITAIHVLSCYMNF